MSLVLAAPFGAEESTGAKLNASDTVEVATVASPRADHVTAETSLGALVNHPAFAGFGRLLLPWDDRSVDRGMRLRDIGTLLPYHTRVVSSVVAGALNRFIDDAAAGQTVAYDIYSAAEKEADPSKRNTETFFLRGWPGAPFAIISPGGGFAYVGSDHEGFPYAAEISARGYNACVLKYRAGQDGAVATQDLAVALSFIMRNARDLDVATAGYSLWWSSAGARMAASIGSHSAIAFRSDNASRPTAVVMAYTAHCDRGPTEPPTFVAVGERDSIAPPSSMKARVAALRATGSDVEYREYPGLSHGFGLGTGTAAAGWVGDPTALALGLPVLRSRLILLAITALASGASTLLVGPVSFVGLMGPHLVRTIGFCPARSHLAGSVVVGAGLMVAADVLARLTFHPYQRCRRGVGWN